MEQMKKELEEMMKKVYANEKALKYLHGFVKMMISRYGIQGDRVMDYKEEAKKMIDAVNDEWLLELIYRTIKNVTKEE